MKNIFSSRMALAIGGLFMFGLVLSSCSKLDNDDNNSDVPVAGLMAFNLAPDKSSVGFAISGNSITNVGLPFTSFTGNYLAIYPGARTIETYDYVSGSAIASTAGTFDAEKYYSTFLIGANNVYKNLVVEDKFDTLSASNGMAYVRYINAIPDSSAPSVTIATGGANVVNENAAYTRVSDFAAITPGSVDITVNNGGTINATRNITLEEKKAYTVLLIGIPGSSSTEQAVQIKFITNGTLTDSTSQRTVSATRSAVTN